MDHMRSNCVTSFSPLPPLVPQHCEGSVPLWLGLLISPSEHSPCQHHVSVPGIFSPDLSPLLCWQSLINSWVWSHGSKAGTFCCSRAHCGQGQICSPHTCRVVGALCHPELETQASAQLRIDGDFLPSGFLSKPCQSFYIFSQKFWLMAIWSARICQWNKTADLGTGFGWVY